MKGYRDLDEARASCEASIKDGSIKEDLPDEKWAATYAIRQMAEFAGAKVNGATMLRAAVLNLVGAVTVCSQQHGPDVRDFVDEQTVKMLRKELASCRSFMDEQIKERA